jgi:hypothetical protein
MIKPRDNEGFRTLRGFLDGREPDEANYFAYSATLRIFGNIPHLDDITLRLGTAPTTAHRRGDRPKPDSPPWKDDMWSYTAQVSENEPLHVHIDTLWNIFREHRKYLLDLKGTATVDVFLGYRSNCDHAGVVLPYQSLEMFRELQVPFGISIIVT